ncbi:MAG: TetR/AcrR family transcriptional regulator [Acidobacteria bacterium]|nr:TetR/AcrR family transcriptional regulator [Acidobacteriota bacterium]
MTEKLLPAPPEAGASTEERLLAAAERLFAERGFAATSVRDITAEAGTSVAAVNYHFGGKDNLYRDLFLGRLRALREQRLAAIGRVVAEAERAAAPIDPGVLLRAFADAFLEPVADPERGRNLVRLLTREFVDGNLPPAVFCEEMIRPVESAFAGALRQALPGIGERGSVLAVHFFVAQLMYVVDIAALAGALDDPHALGGSLASLTDEIVRFSTAGLSAFAPGTNA